ncbi:far upstream element-binding protein 1 [Patella vulgata]|uniref:far upstream element-binding protein 1 n=1 Tax=Patella vulgata TaxID=6465 RepID=UPI00217F64FC|nr:far upstream element-binding protein 1 [Patella vulgata]
MDQAGGAGNAYADALARARQIAAKINQPGAGDAQPQGIKRPFEDGPGFGEPDTKKSTAALNDPIGAQLRAIQDQQRGSSAAQAAQEAAARINQQLGVGPATAPPVIGNPSPHAQLGAVMEETYMVPDKMVGLVIGKGGEQITRLQMETGCKVQIAPDSGGLPDRACRLTGTPQAIAQCKQVINGIIDRAQNNNMDPMNIGEGQTVIEMFIPGNKVGLIIGKGGETIRNLQVIC